MAALRFFCMLLVFIAAVARAEDVPSQDSGYPYTDLTYDALLDGTWTGVMSLGVQSFTIHDHAISLGECLPNPYILIRDQIRVDRAFPGGPDEPRSESYRDIAIKPRYSPPCLGAIMRGATILRFIFTKDNPCTAIVIPYRTERELEIDLRKVFPRDERHNGSNTSCRPGSSP